MLGFPMKRWMTKRALKSFEKRFRIIEKQTFFGKLSTEQAHALWGECVMDCRSYLMDAPGEALPDYLSGWLSLNDKELIRRVMRNSQ